MALTKVTKHIMHGSLLIQYKYADLSDTSVSSNTQTETQIGAGVVITPQYADSILENSFSGSMHNTGTGTNNHFRIALFVNDSKEYEQTELYGGASGGHEATHHGGVSDRLYAQSVYGSIVDQMQSVGFVHAYTPGSTNAQDCDVRGSCQDSNSTTFHVREGFLILKEVSIGITSLSGAQ